MGAHMVVLGTFPDHGIVTFHETGLPGAGAEPVSEHDCGMDRKWTGMLLAAAFPLSPAIAQQAQPSGQQPAATAAPAPAQAPSLGPSMTGPLHLNSDPLHVDGGPLGPIYVSGVISGLALEQDHPLAGD